MEYGSGSGGVWNMALRVEVCGIWLWEWRCVEYGSESVGMEYGCETGGVGNTAVRVEVCGLLL